ncbi:MAG: exo-alpha-sialidase, partial [Bacteroidales bacterium]|nr:exo-alpha-sialidase [Bacteroidales bacterium]
DEPEKSFPESPIDFSRDGFAMRVVGNAYHGANDPGGHFFYSYDSGNSWKGPYSFGAILECPEIKKYGMNDLTPRTDYLVTGQDKCVVFMSARRRGKFGKDRLFCVETSDGGKSFQFLGWVIKPFEENDPKNSRKVVLTDDPEKNPYPTQCRAVMSHSILLDNGEIISVMRRKFEMDRNYNWIDAYKSADGGKTWHFLSRVGDTGLGNGNPPSITLTKDGRFCVVYGERTNGTIQAVISQDKGETWSEPQILMDGFWSEDMEFGDLGYPRVFSRSDGRLVAVYYYSTKDHLHHLRATIFNP